MSKMLNWYEMPVTYGPDNTDWDYEPTNTETQNAQIFAYLKAGNKLTSLVALNKFGCFRLASRISDLRRLHPEEDIRVERVKTIQNKTVAQYYIATL